MNSQSMEIVTDFREACLHDLDQKVERFQQLRELNEKRLANEAAKLIDSLSKGLINLEDCLIKHLRRIIKSIFEHQSKIIHQNMKTTNEILSYKIQTQKQQFYQIRKTIQTNSNKSKRYLSRFAQGKFHQQCKIFQQELEDVGFQERVYTFDEEQIVEHAEEIVELLISKPIIRPQTPFSQELCKSKLSFKQANNPNMSNLSYFSHQSYVVSNKSEAMLKNSMINEPMKQIQEIRSQQLQERDCGTQAIDQYKEFKSLKRQTKFRQSVKNLQKSETTTVSNLAKLVLEKQKLLKDLQ